MLIHCLSGMQVTSPATETTRISRKESHCFMPVGFAQVRQYDLPSYGAA